MEWKRCLIILVISLIANKNKGTAERRLLVRFDRMVVAMRSWNFIILKGNIYVGEELGATEF